jgi:N-methylhydantoinase A/oxoprolinase/acetone carboxylase beta subunit
MMNAIDIDVGGTFTDAVITLDGTKVIAKAPTTPYDLSECFINAVEEGAQALDLEIEELLPRIEIVRYSTTVAMNRLIERRGPRIGLMTTEGHADCILIGRGAQWMDGTRIAERRNLAVQKRPVPLVEPDMIVGIKERIDVQGAVVRPLDEADVRRKLKTLVDKGARAIVVSFLWSFLNPAHEERVKEIIREEYNEYQIGFMPVILAHQVVGKAGEYQRTMSAILDAYLYHSLQRELSDTWDRLRAQGYEGPFLMIHNSGGSADIFKTAASRTFNGGPVAGLIGGFHMSQALGKHNVIVCDMGGTSFDIGVVVEASVRNYDFKPIIDKWMVGISMLETTSIGAGGGSIAWVNALLGNKLEVGPLSAGSSPGPACYDMGGTEPTVTDADVVLGYINPANYFGGQMPLDKRKAEHAIREKIADPLGLSVIEAAALIRRIIGEQMASAIKREIHLRGYHPEDFVLFATGGAGPTHAEVYQDDIPQAIVFPESPVFCAYGQSGMDILHVYEKSRRFVFMEAVTGRFNSDYEHFNETVRELMKHAKRDLEGEGLPVDQARFTLELDMMYGGQVQLKRMSSPHLEVHSPADMEDIYQAFETEFSQAFSPLIVNRPGGVFLDNFVLKTSIPVERFVVPEYPLAGSDPGAASKGERPVYWPSARDMVATAIFDFDRLLPGNVVHGPAVIESRYTTVPVPEGRRFCIDSRKFGVMEAVGPAATVTPIEELAAGAGHR